MAVTFNDLYNLVESVVEVEGERYLIQRIEDRTFIKNYEAGHKGFTPTHLIGNKDLTVILVTIDLKQQCLHFLECLDQAGLYVTVGNHSDMMKIINKALEERY